MPSILLQLHSIHATGIQAFDHLSFLRHDRQKVGVNSLLFFRRHVNDDPRVLCALFLFQDITPKRKKGSLLFQEKGFQRKPMTDGCHLSKRKLCWRGVCLHLCFAFSWVTVGHEVLQWMVENVFLLEILHPRYFECVQAAAEHFYQRAKMLMIFPICQGTIYFLVV